MTPRTLTPRSLPCASAERRHFALIPKAEDDDTFGAGQRLHCVCPHVFLLCDVHSTQLIETVVYPTAADNSDGLKTR